jgi:hypothetical protein
MNVSAGLKPMTKIDWDISGDTSLDRLFHYLYGPDVSVLSMKLLYIESQMITIALKLGYQHHILNNENKKGDLET